LKIENGFFQKKILKKIVGKEKNSNFAVVNLIIKNSNKNE